MSTALCLKRMLLKTRSWLYLLIITAVIGLSQWFYFTRYETPTREINIYYNQDHALNKELIGLIQEADSFVHFAVYTFTRNDIADALLGAKYRGLDVRGITDRHQLAGTPSQSKIIKELREYGIPVAVQDHSAIMHLKVVVTDKAYASGSYNWTTAATDHNDEVLEVGYDEAIRKQYEKILKEVLEKYSE